MSTLEEKGEFVSKIGEVIGNLMVMLLHEYINNCCEFKGWWFPSQKDGGASCFNIDQYRASLFRRSAITVAICS